ncbi:hypothetical protein [Pontibaca salina]|uniref:Clp ATPase C-terminal domain-containing protein n=1 Tax=Pontibaca salina TaxID=2795731 RepID=A0A934HT86_9RHOB|nr:hypothetical protein [Pontibaca salina]MBI6630967.1 hypothetical protein [Pontibaca salina]
MRLGGVSSNDQTRSVAVANFMMPRLNTRVEVQGSAVAILGDEAEIRRDCAMCGTDLNTLAQEHCAASITSARPGYGEPKKGVASFVQGKVEATCNPPDIALRDALGKAGNEVILARLNHSLCKHDIAVTKTVAVRECLCERAIDKRFGVRGLGHASRRHLELPLANLLLERRIKNSHYGGGEAVNLIRERKDAGSPFIMFGEG